MNRQEANKQILDMYNDSTYQELKAYYEKTTIFNVLGVERSETRHSAFLCWLLNADANHGLGGEPMKKLLRLYATKMDDDSSFRIMLMTGDYELEPRSLQVLSERIFRRAWATNQKTYALFSILSTRSTTP